MRSAVVTGGRGFIGRHLVAALVQRGVDVRTIGRTATDHANHFALADDAWNSPALDRILEDAAPDCIFHLAGQAHGTVEELEHANVSLMHSVLRSLRRTGLRPRLLIAGSAAEYGAAIKDGEPIGESAVCAPLSSYGTSKQAQTRAALAFADATGMSVLVARIFNALGPNMPRNLAIGDFAMQIASMPGDQGILHVGNIDVSRDVIDVEHIATLMCQLAETANAQGIVNICSGQAPPLRYLVDLLIYGSGRKVDIEIDWTRVRGNEPRVIVGSVDLLKKLGCPPPPTDLPAVMARICRSMDGLRREHGRAAYSL